MDPSSQELDGQISSFKSLLQLLEQEIQREESDSEFQESLSKIPLNLNNFLNVPYYSSSENIIEQFQNQLQQAKNQLSIILNSIYYVILKENRLLLKEIIQALFNLIQSPKMLIQGQIFSCLKILMSSQQSISKISVPQVSIKFDKLIEIVRKLSLVSLSYIQYQKHQRKNKKQGSFSSRVLQIPNNDSPCSISHFQQINQTLFKKIKSQITFQNLDTFLKTYSSPNQSQICRICLSKININEIKFHVKKCSQKYKFEKQLQDIRNEIVGLRSQMKKREIQLEVTLNKGSDELDQDFDIIVNIYKLLIKDIDKRSLINYDSKVKQSNVEYKNIENLLEQYMQLIQEQQLLHKFYKYFTQQKELKLKILKLQLPSTQKNSQTESKNSKYSQKMSLDSFAIKTPQKNPKKSRFAQAKKKPVEIKLKTSCYFSQKVNRFPLLRKHSSERFIQSREQELQFKNFQVLKMLGKGAFGRVYLVRRTSTKDLYAMKVIPMKSAQYSLVKNEHDIFGKITGDYLVKAVFSFTQGNLHMFFLEYMNGGDFAQLLQKQVYFQQNIAKYYFAQIALAIQKLHQTGIIHRDIKPSNLVLDSDGYMKLTDFGLSKLGITHVITHSQQMNNVHQAATEFVQIQQNHLPGLMRKNSYQKKTLLGYNPNTKRRIIGTPDYIPPEIIKQQSFDNPTIDWWSFGVIIYEALIGQKPFGAQKIDDVFQNILNLKIIWPEIGQQQGMISPQAHDLIGKLLEPDFKKRLGYNGIQQIKHHKFWKDFDWQNIQTIQPPLKTQGQNLSQAQQNLQLKQQIYNMINKSGGVNSRLKRLVRLDVLSQYTLNRAQISSKQSKAKSKVRRSCFVDFKQ